MLDKAPENFLISFPLRDLVSVGLLPKWAAVAGLDQAKARGTAIQVFRVGGRGPNTQAVFFAAFLGALVGSWIGNGAAKT